MKLPPEQEAIQARCFHASGMFIEFPKEDVETSIPERFEKIVRQYPDHTAIETDHELVSYSQLNAVANQMAHNLIARSLPSNEPIALLFEKGIKQIAAMIAVIKAGHFFVIVEPSLPEYRMRMILDDCSTQFMIADLRNTGAATQLMAESARVLACDTEDKDFSGENPNLVISPDDIALIAYTSGSTGRPKAVVNTHRIFLHSIMLRTNVFRCCPSDRVSNLSSGTSNAVQECFYALLNGAALLPFTAQQASAAELRDYLKNQKPTICHIASPLYRQLCEVLTTEDEFPELRVLKLRSDHARKSDIELYKKHFSHNSLLANGLSSSETHDLAYFYFDGYNQLTEDDVPVGYPTPGNEILLLDDNGDQVGYHEVGEIVVRSSHLSLGYWHNPELTAAKFKHDPEDPTKRLYFTGDLGLMLPDGCLVHKGRKDARIKIRGHGVDLNEVEASLRSHKAIRDAVVVDRKDKLGESRLAAYFTSSIEKGPTTRELRKYLSNVLADYMIPAVFVRMKALPTTANGKLDRKALPEPDQERPELGIPYAQPQDETEDSLVKIWERVLAVHPIGIHDNFFDLGGHSLSAARVVSRIFVQYQLEIPLQSLFQSPTIAEMAAVITEHQGKRLDEDQLATILDELALLSDAEAQLLVKEVNSTITKK